MLQISLVFLQQGLVIMLLNTLFLMLLGEYFILISVSVERSNVAGSDSCDGWWDSRARHDRRLPPYPHARSPSAASRPPACAHECHLQFKAVLILLWRCTYDEHPCMYNQEFLDCFSFSSRITVLFDSLQHVDSCTTRIGIEFHHFRLGTRGAFQHHLRKIFSFCKPVIKHFLKRLQLLHWW